MKHTRAFRPAVERRIQERFGIVRPVTDAVRLLRAGQENGDAWLAARTNTIGASEISVLMMADHPYHSRFSLWHVKANGWGKFTQTDQQERGHLLEPGIARRFAEAHPELIVARPNGALWRDPQFKALTCTPDFLTIDADGVIAPLECKSDEGGDGWTDRDIPTQYRWQIWQQSGVFAAPYGYVARWSGRGYRDYLIDYDHDRYCRAADEADQFLRSVADGKSPDPDTHDTTGEVLRDLHPYPIAPVMPRQLPAEWGDELAALKEARKHLDQQIKGLDNKIRDRLGDAMSGWDLHGRTYVRTRTIRKGYTAKPAVLDSVRTREPIDTED